MPLASGRGGGRGQGSSRVTSRTEPNPAKPSRAELSRAERSVTHRYNVTMQKKPHKASQVVTQNDSDPLRYDTDT
ncbi:hypothetical protein E2C01_094458 [Portunus trituberculatus]|uniref:Uncharacterized protein n=1 Tax=Portunus trituberculatus TaxID=210409 RepID=A0A5B7JX79_PORTR|nr:hypothetical protein [Portunus trituberculatus]